MKYTFSTQAGMQTICGINVRRKNETTNIMILFRPILSHTPARHSLKQRLVGHKGSLLSLTPGFFLSNARNRDSQTRISGKRRDT
jgi:hypothetical protein